MFLVVRSVMLTVMKLLNYLDDRPTTPMGATVDARGCWTYAAVVLFDINSAEVKSEHIPCSMMRF